MGCISDVSNTDKKKEAKASKFYDSDLLVPVSTLKYSQSRFIIPQAYENLLSTFQFLINRNHTQRYEQKIARQASAAFLIPF